jgi:hypothetical protein
MRINVAQHVSAVLTSKQSPRGRGGYQTILCTEGSLSDDQIYTLERQVQYVPARDAGGRWQSYRLAPQRHIITRIVPIPEPDESGRWGRFFSHSLIFDTTGRREFDEVMLDLLQPRHFYSSLDRILSAEGLKTGHIPTASFDVDGEWTREARGLLGQWTGEQLNLISMLTNNPRELIEQGQYIALLGDEARILDALKVVFLLTSPEARRFCAFDTYVTGSEPHPDLPLWGRGFPAAAPEGTTFVIDTVRRQVTIPEPSPVRENRFSPEQLSPPVRQLIDRRLNQPSEQMLKYLSERRYSSFVGELGYRSLLHGEEVPLTETDLELLLPFGRSHRGLGLLLALKSGNEEERLRTLADIPNRAEYKQRIGELKTRPDVKAWQLFLPSLMHTWFDVLRTDYTMEDITRAVASVAEHGSTKEREQLICLDEQLDGGQRRELATWLKASSHRLEHLQAALNKPAPTNRGGRSGGKSNSFWRRLRRSFTR